MALICLKIAVTLKAFFNKANFYNVFIKDTIGVDYLHNLLFTVFDYFCEYI